VRTMTASMRESPTASTTAGRPDLSGFLSMSLARQEESTHSTGTALPEIKEMHLAPFLYTIYQKPHRKGGSEHCEVNSNLAVLHSLSFLLRREDTGGKSSQDFATWTPVQEDKEEMEVRRSERTQGEESSRCLEGSSRQPLLVLVLLVLLRMQQQRLKVKGRDQQRKESLRPIWGLTALQSSPRSNWLRRAKEKEEERRVKEKEEKEEKEEEEEVAMQELGLWWLFLLLLLHLLLILSQLGRARAPTAPARRSIREGS
jgi:hypothetical protein